MNNKNERRKNIYLNGGYLIMKLKNLKIEYRENPIGLDVRKPRFSWTMLSNEKNVVQTAYRIIISYNNCEVWDSGKQENDSSVLIEYNGPELKESTVYQVIIEAWDNWGNQAAIQGSFETGLINGENFSADWITHNLSKEETACPIFMKDFQVKKEIEKVRIYATALGIYEIKINGKKAGDTYFSPGWTNYNKRLQYQTYKADDMFTEHNQIEITVGNGWYKGIIGFDPKGNHYGDRVAVLAEIHITYKDGTAELIKTDESWEVTTGSIRSSEFYMGEIIDSCYTGEKVSKAISFSFDKDKIIAQESEAVTINERLSAKEFITTPNGEKVIDFGQNLTGFVELKVKGEKGQKITIRFAETLDKEGNFYTENLRHAKSVDEFICNGKGQVFRPHFTFHGFRYIAIDGLEDIFPKDFTACVLHTDMNKTITFNTSNELVNQLHSNVLWSQKGNFLDIPTDCPQRDERLGWTGDAQVFSGTASYNYNVALFFTKWLHDLATEQTKEYGVPHIIPNVIPNVEGAAVWSDAATIIPWVIYQSYGDIRILEEQYDSMKGWVDFINSRCGDNGLWQTGFQYGDWLALDGESNLSDKIGGTDRYLVANAYYAYSTDIVRKTAKILNRADDKVYYGKLYDNIKQAFNREYITESGRLVSETQTACVLALHFNLVEEKHRESITKILEENIFKHNNHLTTGFVGTPYLCHVLSDNNLHDLAGKVFLQEDYPSWLYAVKKGATTIWERWNSILPNGDFDESGMNSLNHYAYGSIAEWLYKRVAGINPLEPGFKKILIKPQFVRDMDSLEATFASVYGDIHISYNFKGVNVEVNVEIPANTTAIIELPDKKEPIEVGSGFYHFEYISKIDFDMECFSMGSTFKEILDHPLSDQIIKEHAPDLLNHPLLQNRPDMPIRRLVTAYPGLSEEPFILIIDVLNDSLKSKSTSL